MQQKHNRLHGITLVETLSVIVIIAVLAAIIFPVMAGTKRSGKKVSATSNGRQLAVATIMYSGDYDDLPPPYCGECAFSHVGPSMKDGPNIWMVLLFPYAKVSGKPTGLLGMYLAEDLPDLFFDPNENKPRQAGLSCEQFGIITSWGISDVVVNRLGTVSSPGKNVVRSLGSFSDSSNQVLFVQTKAYLCEDRLPGTALAVPPWEGYNGWSASTTVDGIYGGKNLSVFQDSSVRLIPRTVLISSMKHWD